MKVSSLVFRLLGWVNRALQGLAWPLHGVCWDGATFPPGMNSLPEKVENEPRPRQPRAIQEG